MRLGRRKLNRPPIVPLSAFRAELDWYVSNHIWDAGLTIHLQWPNKGAFQVLLHASSWGGARKMSPDSLRQGFCISFREAKAFLALCTQAAGTPYAGKELDDLTAKARDRDFEITISRPKQSRKGTVKISKAFKLPLNPHYG